MFAYAALVGIFLLQDLSICPAKLQTRNVCKLTVKKFFLSLIKEQGLC